MSPSSLDPSEGSSPAESEPSQGDEDIPSFSWDVTAQLSPLSQAVVDPSAVPVAGDTSAPSSSGGGADLAEVAALMENIPGVTLIPPLDEDGIL